jgi:hypothetical protein
VRGGARYVFADPDQGPGIVRIPFRYGDGRLVPLSREGNSDLRGVHAAPVDVPQVGEPVRGLPGDDLSPFVLNAVGGALEDAPPGAPSKEMNTSGSLERE